MRNKSLLRLVDSSELVSVNEKEQRAALKIFYER